MNNDFIRSYIKFKVRRLIGATSFFFMDYDKMLIEGWLNKYFSVYTDTYFYHILSTLDKAVDFGYDTLSKELYGMKEEILDDYSEYEDSSDLDTYQRNRMAIEEMVEVCLMMCELDKIKFASLEDVSKEVISFISGFPNIRGKLQENEGKFINYIKETYTKEEKILKDLTSYFKVDVNFELKKENLYLTKVVHTIKTLEENFKRSMVHRVFSDDRFAIEKLRLLFWKLPRELLLRFLRGEKVNKFVVILDDKIFQRGNIDLFRMIDNPFLKRYLVLGVSFNSYEYHRDFLEYLGFRVACVQDLSHTVEVLDKLNSIDAEKFFNYILITDYKDKDKDVILQYQCSEDLELYIIKEE